MNPSLHLPNGNTPGVPDRIGPNQSSTAPSADHSSTAIPYHSIEDLPDEIRDDLPRHAQEIYLLAYREAWRDYREPENPRIHTTRAEVAHKVALWAVENVYEYDDATGQWLLKNY